MIEHDLTDPLVRDMVERNHDPYEVWTVAGVLVAVACSQCGHTWPCPSIEALRATRGKIDEEAASERAHWWNQGAKCERRQMEREPMPTEEPQ